MIFFWNTAADKTTFRDIFAVLKKGDELQETQRKQI